MSRRSTPSSTTAEPHRWRSTPRLAARLVRIRPRFRRVSPTPLRPTPTVTNSQIDPLYIPVPLYSSPPVPYVQCPAANTCIDHPSTIDLSQLASVLGAPAASLDNVGLPGHDHLLTTRNGDQPEWWNVIVIPVTSPAGLASVESAKSYAAVKALENVSGSGIGVDGIGEVPTNAYLWFQTLPGGSSPTPGPTQTNCMSTLPSGSVVGGAALDDGTGYYETDAQGDVAAFGGATCYGALTGHAPQQADRRHGGRPEHRGATGWSLPTEASSPSMLPTWGRWAASRSTSRSSE